MPTSATPQRRERHLPWLFALGSGVAHADFSAWLPQGPVAAQQWDLMGITVGLMLLVLIPVFVLTIWIPWRYRATNRSARYTPDWSHSRAIDILVWLFPAAIVVALASLAWLSAHRLDPYQALPAAEAPLRVQVIGMDWKWLFIYPDRKVATVNYLILPVGRPVSFELTSATVTNSFFIPRLGSQIYAMPGMTTQLNLQADQTGSLMGRNTQYSGRGFADQQFPVSVVTASEFAHWQEQTQQTAPPLDAGQLERFLTPSADAEPQTFGYVPDGLFGQLRARFSTPVAR